MTSNPTTLILWRVRGLRWSTKIKRRIERKYIPILSEGESENALKGEAVSGNGGRGDKRHGHEALEEINLLGSGKPGASRQP